MGTKALSCVSGVSARYVKKGMEKFKAFNASFSLTVFMFHGRPITLIVSLSCNIHCVSSVRFFRHSV